RQAYGKLAASMCLEDVRVGDDALLGARLYRFKQFGHPPQGTDCPLVGLIEGVCRHASQIRPSPVTALRSSANSAVDLSMRPREKSSISRPVTIVQLPSLVVTGKEECRPSGTPCEPSETTAIETQSPSGVPSSHSRAASVVADAAEAADEAPRASMIAAPRLATVGMKSLSIQFWSLTTSAAFLPLTSAWKM